MSEIKIDTDTRVKWIPDDSLRSKITTAYLTGLKCAIGFDGINNSATISPGEGKVLRNLLDKACPPSLETAPRMEK